MYQVEILLSLIIASSLLGTCFIILVVAISRIQQRHKEVLYKLNILTEISLLEKERALLAHELHEEFGPSFSYLKLSINHLKYTTDMVSLTESTVHIDEMMERIRNLSYELLPPTFKHFGLTTTLERLIQDITATHPLEIKLNVADNLPELKDHKALYIYRILQEIIHNTVKYAQATRLMILLKTETDQLLLTTKDNGKGFDYLKALRTGTGLGLKSISNRTQALGGFIQVLSKPGQGTVYMIAIPL